jgi:hypothetical protein
VRKPFSGRRLLTLCADIRRRPGTFDAVSLAVTVRFSGEVPGCSDLELLMCPCCATG